MDDLRVQLISSLTDIINDVVQVAERQNEDEIMGRITRLVKSIETDTTGDAAVELALLVRALDIITKLKD